MDIDRCNSIFELFTAFNFTYAVLTNTNQESLQKEEYSKGFSYVELIDNQLLRPYTPYKDFFQGAKQLENNIIIKKDSCKNGLEIENGKVEKNESFLKELTDLQSKFDGLEGSVNIWNQGIDNTKSEVVTDINERFPYISFLSALFCISVLGIAASEASYKHFTLLLLDLLVIFLIIPVIRKKDSTSYPQIIKKFSIGLFFLMVIHFGIKVWYESFNEFACKCLTFLDTDSIWKSLFIIANIFIPFWHFIYYYFRLSSMFVKMKKEKEDSLKVLNTTYDDLAKKYSALTNSK